MESFSTDEIMKLHEEARKKTKRIPVTSQIEMNLDKDTKKEPFSERNRGVFQRGFTRQQIKEFLKSINPYRTNINFTEEDLFMTELHTKLGMDMSQVHAYNEMVKHVRDFLERNVVNKALKEHVEIMVKITRAGSTEYREKSHIYPNELIKNKLVKQHIAFMKVSSGRLTEIKTIPMMVGCEWCVTYGKNPIELHNVGENAADHKGYFIMESQKSTEAKYFVAHEKVCHNCIITIIDDNKGFLTSLKSQDALNNSMEINVFKEGDIYRLGSVDFRISIPTNQIFKQIYKQMKEISDKDEKLIHPDTYKEFMEKIIRISTVREIRQFFMYDFMEGSSEILPPSEINDIETALNYLFLNEERKKLFASMTSEHSTIDRYPSMIIDSIFSAVYIPQIIAGKDKNPKPKIEFNILQAKAMLLIRMILMNNLVEQGIMKKTDRDDLSYKCFMNAAEVMKRDLTRDGGNIFKDENIKDYKPNATESKGETNVFEALTFSNHLETKSTISKSSTPRSSHSRNLSVRSVRPSQNGFKCLFQTPSGGNIGLVHHFGITCFFSFAKNTTDMLEYLIKYLIEKENYNVSNLFTEEKLSDTEKEIDLYLSEKEMKINEILLFKDDDFKILRSRNKLIEENKDFFIENRKTMKSLFKIYNYVSNLDFKPEELYEKIDTISNFPYDIDVLKAAITKKTWSDFLGVRNKFFDNNIPFETIIMDIDHPVNNRLNVWKFIEGKKIGYEVIEEIEKKKKKLLSLNSIPFALIDHYTYEKLRKFLKRDYRFMDVAVIEEKYEISFGSVKHLYTSSYNIYCDGGRVCRPLYNVEELKARNLLTDSAINDYLKNKLELEDIISDGVIEMVLPIELQYDSIAEFRKYVTMESKQKYAEIDPNALFGAVSACAPMLNHCPGNRSIHESAMSVSALTEISTNFKNTSETSAKLLHCPETPTLITKTSAYYNNLLRNGVNIFIGIKIDEGNVEDSFLINERVAKMITDAKISTYEIIIENSEIRGISSRGNYKMKKYHAINPDTGFPYIGARLEVGDVIFAKYKEEIIEQIDEEGNKLRVEQIVNKSEFIEEGKEGEVQDIQKINNDKVTIYRITVSKTRTMGVGRKLAFDGCSQKGIIGQILPNNKMPLIISGKNKGRRLGGAFSPLSMSSRGTPGVAHTLLMGTYAAATGKQVDATSFTVNDERLIKINEELVEMGYNDLGYEECQDPATGNTFKLMCGFAYIKILKHAADDKQKARGHLDHTIDKSSKQPSKGGPTGALRVGYMDTGTFASHNVISIIQTLLAEQSDLITVSICSNCGHLCDRHNDDPKTIKDNYASKFCTRCHNQDVIVKVNVPYAVIKIHNWSLSVGIKMNMFPKLVKK